MRYTRWLETHFPDRRSSAESYDLIRRAKKSSLLWTLVVRVLLYAIALVLVDLVGGWFGITRFEGLSGWFAVALALGLAEALAGVIEQVIVTSKIRKLSKIGELKAPN